MQEPDKVIRGDRSIKAEYTLTEKGDERIVAEVVVRHHGKAQMYGQPEKCYTASLSQTPKAIIRDRQGKRIGESQTVDLRAQSVMLFTEPTARFSRRGLEVAFAKALATLEANRDNDRVAALFTPEKELA